MTPGDDVHTLLEAEELPEELLEELLEESESLTLLMRAVEETEP